MYITTPMTMKQITAPAPINPAFRVVLIGDELSSEKVCQLIWL